MKVFKKPGKCQFLLHVGSRQEASWAERRRYMPQLFKAVQVLQGPRGVFRGGRACSCLAAAVRARAFPATAAVVYLGRCCYARTLIPTETFWVAEVAVTAEFFSPANYFDFQNTLASVKFPQNCGILTKLPNYLTH